MGRTDDVVAAYDAPFPSAESKAGARAFPLLLPWTARTSRVSLTRKRS